MARRRKASEVRLTAMAGSEELVAKFESEINVEEDIKSDPKEFKEYFEGVWELHEQPGNQEVKLTRRFNDETIEVSFSVADASSMEQQGLESAEDEAYEDEEFDEPESSAQSGGANTKGAINQGRTREGNIRIAPEDRVAPADRPELGEEGGEYADEEGERGASFPVRLVVKITRDGKPGVVEVEAEAAGGYIEIQNAAYWPSADLAARTAEAEQQRMVLYGGPSFATLDEDLQQLMQTYLEERGIDVEMSLRLPDIVDWKEQKEYVKWLHGKYTASFPGMCSANDIRHEELLRIVGTAELTLRLSTVDLLCSMCMNISSLKACRRAGHCATISCNIVRRPCIIATS
jgi:complement component 1 Q subcomponent-binding protein, mitochondrial